MAETLNLDELEREHRAATEHNAFGKLIAEVRRLRALVAKLDAAAPVVLTAMAFLADEANTTAVREVALWFVEHLDPGHLETWTDAERRRSRREEAP